MRLTFSSKTKDEVSTKRKRPSRLIVERVSYFKHVKLL